jgi:putative ABC transport system permease protein
MKWFGRMRQRAAVLLKERVDPDLDDELQFHLEEAVQANMAAGMSPQEARYAALQRLGNVTLVKEDSRRVWLLPALEALVQDLRYGARILRKNPGFTTVATLTLALGIGANTAIFSMVNAALLKRLPYPHQERLYSLRGGHSLPDVMDTAQMTHAFESLGAYAGWGLDMTGHGEPKRLDAALVAGELFPALGVRAAMGRTFDAKDDAARTPVVVLSHRVWQQTMQSDGSAVGKVLTLSGQQYTVIGVMPPEFKLPDGTSDVYLPFRVGYPEAANARGAHFMTPVGRLRADVTRPQAQLELDALGKKLGALYPTEARTFVLQPLHERMVHDVRTPLLVLWSAVACVLLIACSNFASLLLARVAARAGEMKVRSALGAGRGRLVRQLLTESLLLSLLGGLLGVLFAMAGVRLLLALKPRGLELFHPVAIDSATLLFALGVSVLTGLVFGLAPAFQFWSDARSDAVGNRATTRSLLRRGLVVMELAAALLLLVGAGLLLRSFWALHNVDPGIRPERVLTMKIAMPATRYGPIAKQEAFLDRLNQSLRELPGSESAGFITELPMSGYRMMHNMAFQDRSFDAGKEPEIGTHEISPGYLSTMGTPLLLGRGFTEADSATAPLVGIINQSMAQQFWAGQSPIGKQVRWARTEGPPQWMTIVGVAGNVHANGLDEDEMPTIYTPYTEKQQAWKRWLAIVVRTRAEDPLMLAGEVQRRVWQLDDQLPVTEVFPMPVIVAESVGDRRFSLTLLLMFAVVALALAVIGIYGVISYLVTQRTREIGIRMALGAQRWEVRRMIVKQGLALMVVGVATGVAGALVATRLLKTLLFGVSRTDPATFAFVVALLAAVALLASYIPARRASRIDPMQALRYE